MKFNRKGFNDQRLIELYKALLKPRMIEEKMLIALRQGKISKWFSAFGQEAVSVGAAMAMNPDSYLLPMHRNLGIFTSRDVPLTKLFAQFQAKSEGFTKGRDRSFHFGSKEHKIVGMISHLGPQMGIADGIGLAQLLKKSSNATLVITGDGGASQGDFHEALNVAAVWGLPVIFLIENNHWGLSTPSSEQFNFKSFVYKAAGYGVKAKSVDGNNILEVYRAVEEIQDEIAKRPQPYIFECNTFRLRGHEEASGTKYYPQGLIEEWSKKDPVENYRKFLLEEKILSPEENEQIVLDIKSEINAALKMADSYPEIDNSIEEEFKDLFAPYDFIAEEPKGEKENVRMVDAIHQAIDQSMERFDNLVIMGQDIAEYGGVFKVTEGLLDKYGKERVRNTPLCESAIVGSALGLSIEGYKAIMEMQFSDFVTEGFNQIVNNLAKIHWRWGQNADVVVRMPTGAGVGAGPFHSQSTEAWFTHTAGLKVVYPAFPEDAKGLLNEAIADPNPVLFFEHKALYRSSYQDVAKAYYRLELGKAATIQSGTDCTIISYGMGVHWALDFAKENPNYSIEIIDLRTLSPIDWPLLIESVNKTSRCLVLQEDVTTGGIGSDIVRHLQKECFKALDAPIAFVASLDTPVPFARKLEERYLGNYRLQESFDELMSF